MKVQAFINNIGFLSSVSELQGLVASLGCYSLEQILTNTDEEWTAPKWAQIGDIVFFYHAKHADAKIRKLQRELETFPLFESERQTLASWLERALHLHHQYGGKIFAIGIIADVPFCDNYVDEHQHWKSRVYALTSNIHVLHHMVDIEEIKDYIFITRQSAITPVLGGSFSRLKQTIIQKNIDLPAYFHDSYPTTALPAQMKSLDWLASVAELKPRFMLEAQLRAYYTDHLLRELSDTMYFDYECVCYKQARKSGTVDNVIRIMGTFIPVEIKLNVRAEKDICAQLKRYLYCQKIVTSGGGGVEIDNNIAQQKMLVIDQLSIYLFSSNTNTLEIIKHLKDIQKIQDIKALRKTIITLFGLDE